MNTSICAGLFCGGELEPGTFHGSACNICTYIDVPPVEGGEPHPLQVSLYVVTDDDEDQS